ncbi:MAG: hypothetical protein ACLVHE_03255 [Dialister invisus]
MISAPDARALRHTPIISVERSRAVPPASNKRVGQRAVVVSLLCRRIIALRFRKS